MIKKIALFLIALLPLGAMAQNVKLGHVNSQEVISLMPELETIQKQLKDTQDLLEKELLKMREEYNAKVKEFVDNQATMPETIKQARQSEISLIEERINTFNQQATVDVQKKQQDLVSPVLEKVKKAINDVAEEGGYTYIFDIASQSIVYQSKTANNITPLVKKKLNLKDVPATVAKPAAAPVAQPGK